MRKPYSYKIASPWPMFKYTCFFPPCISRRHPAFLKASVCEHDERALRRSKPLKRAVVNTGNKHNTTQSAAALRDAASIQTTCLPGAVQVLPDRHHRRVAAGRLQAEVETARQTSQGEKGRPWGAS